MAHAHDQERPDDETDIRDGLQRTGLKSAERDFLQALQYRNYLAKHRLSTATIDPLLQEAHEGLEEVSAAPSDEAREVVRAVCAKARDVAQERYYETIRAMVHGDELERVDEETHELTAAMEVAPHIETPQRDRGWAIQLCRDAELLGFETRAEALHEAIEALDEGVRTLDAFPTELVDALEELERAMKKQLSQRIRTINTTIENAPEMLELGAEQDLLTGATITLNDANFQLTKTMVEDIEARLVTTQKQYKNARNGLRTAKQKLADAKRLGVDTADAAQLFEEGRKALRAGKLERTIEIVNTIRAELRDAIRTNEPLKQKMYELEQRYHRFKKWGIEPEEARDAHENYTLAIEQNDRGLMEAFYEAFRNAVGEMEKRGKQLFMQRAASAINELMLVSHPQMGRIEADEELKERFDSVLERMQRSRTVEEYKSIIRDADALRARLEGEVVQRQRAVSTKNRVLTKIANSRRRVERLKKQMKLPDGMVRQLDEARAAVKRGEFAAARSMADAVERTLERQIDIEKPFVIVKLPKTRFIAGRYNKATLYLTNSGDADAKRLRINILGVNDVRDLEPVAALKTGETVTVPFQLLINEPGTKQIPVDVRYLRSTDEQPFSSRQKLKVTVDPVPAASKE